MNITDIVTALEAHNYLAVFVLLTLYVRKLTGPDSQFPMTIAPQWRPVVSALAGLAYGVLTSVQSGMAAGAAVLGGVVAAGASGFLDGILMAIWSHNDAPGWAKAIVFIFDNVAAGTPPSPPAIKFGLKKPPTLMFPPAAPSVLPVNPPKAMRMRSVWAASLAALVAVVIVSCTGALSVPPNVPDDVKAEVDCVASKLLAGDTVLASLAVCVGGDLKIAADIVEWLLGQASFAAKLPPSSAGALRANIHTFRLTLPPETGK